MNIKIIAKQLPKSKVFLFAPIKSNKMYLRRDYRKQVLLTHFSLQNRKKLLLITNNCIHNTHNRIIDIFPSHYPACD